MVIGKTGHDMITPISTVQYMKEYNYPGVMLNSNGRDNKDIQGRKLSTRQINSVLWSKNIHMNTKKYIFKYFPECCASEEGLAI